MISEETVGRDPLNVCGKNGPGGRERLRLSGTGGENRILTLLPFRDVDHPDVISSAGLEVGSRGTIGQSKGMSCKEPYGAHV